MVVSGVFSASEFNSVSVFEELLHSVRRNGKVKTVAIRNDLMDVFMFIKLKSYRHSN